MIVIVLHHDPHSIKRYWEIGVYAGQGRSLWELQQSNIATEVGNEARTFPDETHQMVALWCIKGNLFLMRATKLLDDETLKCRQQHRTIQICRYLGTCTFKTIYNGDVRPTGCPGNAQFRFLNGPTIPIQAERTCRASVICISFVYISTLESNEIDLWKTRKCALWMPGKKCKCNVLIEWSLNCFEILLAVPG